MSPKFSQLICLQNVSYLLNTGQLSKQILEIH